MFLLVSINTVLVALAVIIHYEFLRMLSVWLPKLKIPLRPRIVVGIFGAMIAHVIEIWLFAFAFYFMLESRQFGSFGGNFDGSLLDCSYFSFTTYTSLGFGDIEPLGQIRFLVALEALTGLVLITWTASFMFLEMTKFWKDK